MVGGTDEADDQCPVGGVWHFLKLVVRGFLRELQFPPLPSSVHASANRIKLK